MSSSKRSILIVSAGVMQIPAILSAKELGLTVIGTDRNPDAAGFRYCDVAVPLDSKDVEGHVRFAVENAGRLNLKAAFAGSDCAITVAEVTQALGLPGIPPDVARRSNNKALMKERWIRDGIPTPFGGEATTIAEAKALLARTGFPAIVKAVDNAASRGSMRIDAPEQLPEALENAKAASTTRTAMIEEYVVGEEQSVETIVWKGKHYHISVADRIFGYRPYHVEMAHVDPSTLPSDTQERIVAVVDAAARSLGVTLGPAKADMIWTHKGPMILEMPTRLSGGFHSQYTTPLSTGKSPIKAVMQIALGDELDESLIRGDRTLTSVCAGIFPKGGVLKAIHGLDEARGIQGVEEIIITKKPGDVIGPYYDNAQRVCWVIVVGRSREHAFEIVKQAERAIRFEVE